MNKWLPAVAVGAFALTAGVLYLAGGSEETKETPLTPPAGESLRLRPQAPAPVTADPARVKEALAGRTLLAGDAALYTVLEEELAGGSAPTYRTLIDLPFAENAAHELRDEVKGWLDRKMAAYGFAVAQSKPSVLWRVALDPGEQGAWRLTLTLRRGGDEALKRELELPAAFTPDRLDRLFAADFEAPPK